MSRSLIFNLTISVISLAIALTVAEIVVRKIGGFDADGNFVFQTQKLLPYRLPIIHSFMT